MGGLIQTPFVKQPWEQRRVRYNWAEDCQPLIDNDYVYSTVEVQIYDSDGVNVTSSMIQGTPTRSGNFVYASIKAGTDGQTYYCRIRVTLTKTGYEDEQLEADQVIQVIEKGK